MSKSIIEILIGSFDEKRTYNNLMKRVNALPHDYRFAYKKIQNYLYNVDLTGCDFMLFGDLLELFEESSANGTSVLQIIGSDISAFSDELVRASSDGTSSGGAARRDAFNAEIIAKLSEMEEKNV